MTDSDEAVMLAYAAVRDSLAGTVGAGRNVDTHWEFLRVCQADGLGEDTIDSLTEITEAYERAAYAPVSIDRAAAESAIETAMPLLSNSP